MALDLGLPKFCKAQSVSFVGGKGIICSYKAEAGSWMYLIEMALGVEPLCGRVGAETMVIIDELDLQAQDKSSSQAFSQ